MNIENIDYHDNNPDVTIILVTLNEIENIDESLKNLTRTKDKENNCSRCRI